MLKIPIPVKGVQCTALNSISKNMERQWQVCIQSSESGEQPLDRFEMSMHLQQLIKSWIYQSL